MSEAELVAAIAHDRSAGRRVALVGGVFDVLRVGDVRSLQAAAAGADRLAVLVHDSDAATIVKAEDRAELVAGLRGVDYVTVCAAADVDRLLAL